MRVREQLTWLSANRCESGACVEIAFATDGTVHVRDSKDRAGPVLRFTPAEWEAFRLGVLDGEFTP